MPHETTVLSVATPVWLHYLFKLSPFTLVSFPCLLRAAEAKHLRWCDGQNFNVSMSASYEKVSGIVNISNMTGHVCEIGQMTTTMSPQFLMSNLAFYYIGFREIARLFSLQNKPTGNPTTNPYSHHDATEKVEEFTAFCAVASSNGALPTPSRLSEHHPLPLSDVAQKTCTLQTTHTIRAQSRRGAARHLFGILVGLILLFVIFSFFCSTFSSSFCFS